MQKLEVLIEENAFGSVRPIEVIADTPVSALVPALVEELKLPQTDLFGKKLVYMLRQAAGGHIIAENTSLISSGIGPGARLALDSYVLDGSATVRVQIRSQGGPIMFDPEMHSSTTIADSDQFSTIRREQTSSGILPVAKNEQKWKRRTLLALGGVVLGAGGTSLGYTVSHAIWSSLFKTVARQPTSITNMAGPTQPITFTMAKPQVIFIRHQKLVRSVAWSPDGTMLASGADDAHLFIWEANGTARQDIRHPTAVRAIAWASDGQRIVTAAGSQVAFFSTLTGKMLARPIRRHNKVVTSLAWAAGGQMRAVSAATDLRAIVWNTTNYRPQLTYALHTAPIDAISLSADGQTAATASQGGFVRVWNVADGQDLHGFYQDAKTPMQAIAFSPIGTQLAVGGADGIVRIWNGTICQMQTNGQCVDIPQRLQVSQKAIRSLAWSPDAHFLAVGTDDHSFSIWDPLQPQKPLVMVTQDATVHSVAWSPHSNQLASASGNRVTIWALV